MEWLAAITTGGLAGLGLWMLLDRNLKRVVLGIVVLGNAINLGLSPPAVSSVNARPSSRPATQ